MSALGVNDISDALNQIRSLLKKKAKHAYLFGSILKNAAIPFESDVDVLIIPEKGLSSKQADELLKKPWKAIIEKGLVLRPIVFDRKRHPAWLLKEAQKGVQLL